MLTANRRGQQETCMHSGWSDPGDRRHADESSRQTIHHRMRIRMLCADIQRDTIPSARPEEFLWLVCPRRDWRSDVGLLGFELPHQLWTVLAALAGTCIVSRHNSPVGRLPKTWLSQGPAICSRVRASMDRLLEPKSRSSPSLVDNSWCRHPGPQTCPSCWDGRRWMKI